MNRLVSKLDRWQQRHRPAAFAVAVFRRFSVDGVGRKAVAMSYYAFFAIFPLLLLLVSVTGVVLRGNSELRSKVIDSALAEFPIVGSQLQTGSQGALPHSLAGFLVGAVGLLFGARGIALASAASLAEVWRVPLVDRPGLVARLWRSAAFLGGLGVALIAAGFCSTAATTAGMPWWIVWTAVGLVISVTFALLCFSVLLGKAVALRDLAPAALITGCGWMLLLEFGGYFVTHQLKNSGEVYGFFAIVIGILAWLTLQSEVVLLANVAAAVRRDRDWPVPLRPDAPETAGPASERDAT